MEMRKTTRNYEGAKVTREDEIGCAYSLLDSKIEIIFPESSLLRLPFGLTVRDDSTKLYTAKGKYHRDEGLHPGEFRSCRIITNYTHDANPIHETVIEFEGAKANYSSKSGKLDITYDKPSSGNYRIIHPNHPHDLFWGQKFRENILNSLLKEYLKQLDSR